MRVIEWADVEGRMTVSTLLERYQVPAFHLAERRYPAGTSFAGQTRAAIWFVLAGACEVIGDEVVVVTAGQGVEIEAGAFSLTVIGDHELRLLQVWDLRPLSN